MGFQSSDMGLAGEMMNAAYAMTPLAQFANEIKTHRESNWAWDHTKETIAALAALCGAKTAIEIGGGRDPLFTAEEAMRLGLAITLNDISANELRHAPPGFSTACFDIASKSMRDQAGLGAYDLAFSRMVFEHVRDARQAWSNVHALLAPGGVGFAFIPTLYTLPFLVNRYVPETLSSAVVRMLYPNRTDRMDPKFPAFYDLCVGRENTLRPVLQGIGFREVYVAPFFGHEYFKAMPGVRDLDRMLNNLAAAHDWTKWAAYAFVMARK